MVLYLSSLNKSVRENSHVLTTLILRKHLMALSDLILGRMICIDS